MTGCECCDNFSMIDGGDEFKAFPGLKGDDGTTFYPHVSADGVLSWTNDGGKQNPDPVNIKGADGKSAYQASVEAGFSGTEAEFNEYLSNIGVLTDEVADQKSAVEDLQALTNRKAGMLVDTASGAIASFVPDSTIPDLLGVSVAVEPVQAGSGDPSPDNVRPISGWDAVEVQRTGKNLWNGAWVTTALNVEYSGAWQTNYIPGNLALPVTPGASYTFSVDGAPVLMRYAFLDAQKNQIGGLNNATTVTAPANARYLKWRWYGDGSTSSGDLSQSAQLENGSSATAFKPYTGNTYAISLGQTVYGCKLTIAEDGSVTALVDRAKYAYQGTETAVLAQEGTYGYRIGFDLPSTARVPTTTAERLDAISNIMVADANVVDASRFRPGMFELYPRTTAICTCMCIVPLEYNTPALAKQWLADNGFEIVYKLAAPIEISLDPVTISTISGQTNNVWADAGDVSVEYAADIKAYIDRLNQSPEDDMIANTLIAANKYFTVNNKLYLSTASIAAGAQIIPGTNCTETSLVEALNALNA